MSSEDHSRTVVWIDADPKELRRHQDAARSANTLLMCVPSQSAGEALSWLRHEAERSTRPVALLLGATRIKPDAVRHLVDEAPYVPVLIHAGSATAAAEFRELLTGLVFVAGLAGGGQGASPAEYDLELEQFVRGNWRFFLPAPVLPLCLEVSLLSYSCSRASEITVTEATVIGRAGKKQLAWVSNWQQLVSPRSGRAGDEVAFMMKYSAQRDHFVSFELCKKRGAKPLCFCNVPVPLDTSFSYYKPKDFGPHSEKLLSAKWSNMGTARISLLAHEVLHEGPLSTFDRETQNCHAVLLPSAIVFFKDTSYSEVKFRISLDRPEMLEITTKSFVLMSGIIRHVISSTGEKELEGWIHAIRQTIERKDRYMGVPIDDIMKLQRTRCIDLPIPFFVSELLDHIKKRGLKEPGIFRQSGSLQSINEALERIQPGVPLLLPDQEIHVVTGILKRFLQELPGGLFTANLSSEFIEIVGDLKSELEFAHQLKALVIDKLPAENREILKRLVETMRQVTVNIKDTLMDSQALGIAFGPSMLPLEGTGRNMLEHVETPKLICVSLIEQYQFFFEGRAYRMRDSFSNSAPMSLSLLQVPSNRNAKGPPSQRSLSSCDDSYGCIEDDSSESECIFESPR